MSVLSNTDPLPALISIAEAAKLLGLKRSSAYRYAKADQLPVKRFGRRVYVIRAALTDVLPQPGGQE